jgi:hypothetical protein
MFVVLWEMTVTHTVHHVQTQKTETTIANVLVIMLEMERLAKVCAVNVLSTFAQQEGRNLGWRLVLYSKFVLHRTIGNITFIELTRYIET